MLTPFNYGSTVHLLVIVFKSLITVGCSLHYFNSFYAAFWALARVAPRINCGEIRKWLLTTVLFYRYIHLSDVNMLLLSVHDWSSRFIELRTGHFGNIGDFKLDYCIPNSILVILRYLYVPLLSWKVLLFLQVLQLQAHVCGAFTNKIVLSKLWHVASVYAIETLLVILIDCSQAWYFHVSVLLVCASSGSFAPYDSQQCEKKVTSISWINFTVPSIKPFAYILSTTKFHCIMYEYDCEIQ